MMHSAAKTKKTPAQVIAFSRERKVDAHVVLTIRLANVASDTPLDLTEVVKTSDGINQEQGPIPTAKNDRYHFLQWEWARAHYSIG